MIYLLRHGETVWNRADRRQGRLDSPLTLRGIAQARAVGGLLGDLLGDAALPMYSSPLGRAWQTATIVAETLAYDSDRITTDERLSEVAYGRWEAMTPAEISHSDPEHWAKRLTDRWSIAPPGGESFVDLQDRLSDWLGEQDLGRDMIVIGHGALNRAFVGLLAQLSPDQALALPEDQHCLFRLSEGFYDIMGPAELDI